MNTCDVLKEVTNFQIPLIECLQLLNLYYIFLNQNFFCILFYDFVISFSNYIILNKKIIKFISNKKMFD
jgi:hypothetical protein